MYRVPENKILISHDYSYILFECLSVTAVSYNIYRSELKPKMYYLVYNIYYNRMFMKRKNCHIEIKQAKQMLMPGLHEQSPNI